MGAEVAGTGVGAGEFCAVVAGVDCVDCDRGVTWFGF